MTTLVIHPSDKSTDFLKPIYEGIKDCTIVTGGVTKDELMELISVHKRIIMLGHGVPQGLMSIGKFPTSNGLIIDSSFVELLNEKTNNVYIWCNADQFVNKYKLKGFYSGMFVSEVGESNYYQVPSTQDVVTESNFSFSVILGNHINEDKNTMFKNVMREYGVMTDVNIVSKYNHERLYLR